MIFRQLFDRETCTYTYLLADEDSRDAVLIDPVRDLFDRDKQLLAELELTLRYTLETHIHADHVTASGLFRLRVGSRSVVSSQAGASCADVLIEDGGTIRFGRHSIEARHTPGHTGGCVSYYLPDQGAVFTGDALFVRGCGRTDFQQGSAESLYDSVHGRILSLSDATTIYPGHDYKGRTSSTVAEEKAHNPRLGGGRTKAQFVQIMDNLKLSDPARIHIAVPANLQCGLLPEDRHEAASGAWTVVTRAAEGIPEVSVALVSSQRGAFRLIDVRELDEFTGPLSHIAGAELIPLATLATASAGWDRNAEIVLICRSGGRSGRAALTLEGLGFCRVASMAGGMMAWRAMMLPTA